VTSPTPPDVRFAHPAVNLWGLSAPGSHGGARLPSVGSRGVPLPFTLRANPGSDTSSRLGAGESQHLLKLGMSRLGLPALRDSRLILGGDDKITVTPLLLPDRCGISLHLHNQDAGPNRIFDSRDSDAKGDQHIRSMSSSLRSNNLSPLTSARYRSGCHKPEVASLRGYCRTLSSPEKDATPSPESVYQPVKEPKIKRKGVFLLRLAQSSVRSVFHFEKLVRTTRNNGGSTSG